MDLELVKLMIQGGAVAILGVVLLWFLKIFIPQLQTQFLAALAEQRKDYLAAEERREVVFTQTVERQRTDHLTATDRQQTEYWRQFDLQRQSCAEQAALDREAWQRGMDALAKAVQGQGDLLLSQWKHPLGREENAEVLGLREERDRLVRENARLKERC